MNLSSETIEDVRFAILQWKQDEINMLLDEADLIDPEVWRDIAKIAKEIEELLISLG